jgi:magnesium-transporting ATPase (P-type)
MPAVKKLLVIISLFFYIVSCCIYAYNDKASEGGMLGILCLVLGWLSFTSSFAAFVGWMANFPYFINVIMVLTSKRTSLRIVSSMLAVISLFLSFGAFAVTEVMKDEGGTMQAVSFGPGLFVWMVSLIIMIVAAILPAEKKTVEVEYINNPNPY